MFTIDVGGVFMMVLLGDSFFKGTFAAAFYTGVVFS